MRGVTLPMAYAVWLLTALFGPAASAGATKQSVLYLECRQEGLPHPAQYAVDRGAGTIRVLPPAPEMAEPLLETETELGFEKVIGGKIVMSLWVNKLTLKSRSVNIANAMLGLPASMPGECKRLEPQI